jgi:hypothetical protein
MAFPCEVIAADKVAIIVWPALLNYKSKMLFYMIRQANGAHRGVRRISGAMALVERSIGIDERDAVAVIEQRCIQRMAITQVA